MSRTAAGNGAGGRSRSGRRRTIIRAGLLLALLAGMVFALSDIVPGSAGRLNDLSVGWVLVAVGSELISLSAYAALFHGVFAPGYPELTRRRSAQIGVGELGAFAVVPTGAGGPVLRVWALMASGMTLSVVMTRSVVHAVIFNLPYIAVAAVLGIGVLIGVGPGHAPTLVALAPVGVVLAVLAVTLAAGRYAVDHPQPSGNRWSRLGFEIVRAIPAGLRAAPGRLRDPRLIGAAIAYWAGDCGVLVIACAAVHGSAPLGVIVLAYLFGQLGNALPLPGGVGGVEPLMLGVFTASGVDSGLAAAAIVVYRFVSLGLQATTGSVAVASLARVLDRGSAAVAAQLR